MRLKYVLSEVMVGLWRNVTMTVAMIITFGVSLTMLGASALMFLQVNAMKDAYYDKIEVSIFLTGEVTDAQRATLDTQLKNDPLVRSFYYESKSQAYEKFKRLFADAPDLVSAVKPDGLPESFRVQLKNPEKFQEVSNKYAGSQGVEEIIDQQKLLSRLFGIVGSVQTLALITASIMAVAALLLVGNTIQVAAYSKRREVAVMKLVGASNWFIQSPFVLEAVFAGLIGALLAFGALLLGKWLLIDGSLKDLTSVLTPVPWKNVLLTLPFMAAVGGVVSAVTAWVTLRFYIRV
ncbi:MAG TPA: permease-like cell division protein FtsX [Micromonosporaceae bacterium]|jgi:cell division transport system permease protein